MSENINHMDDFELVYPDSVDPVLTAKQKYGIEAFVEKKVRVPNTTPVVDGKPNLHASSLTTTPFRDTTSILGHPITGAIHGPLEALEDALWNLDRAARRAGNIPLADLSPVFDVRNILLGKTAGQVFDGFGLLNYNAGALTPDHVPHEYKMKRLQDTGETVVSQIDGQEHKIWEITVNTLWTGQNFDADTFLIRVPATVHDFDELRIKWRVYSMIQEDLAPTTILNDDFGRIFHGLDSTFLSMVPGHLNEITIKYPSLKNFRGLYNWGWGVHPPRIQFLQPVLERTLDDPNGVHLESADGTGTESWHPFSASFVKRNRDDLTIENIGKAAPEKKIYRVAQAALDGATGTQISRMLNERNTAPRGIFTEWINLIRNQRQLPAEAWDVIAHETGVVPEDRDIGPYDVVVAYLNNKLYGVSRAGQPNADGKGDVVDDFEQGDITRVKVINLDNHTHYYRNVDFGAQFFQDNKKAFGNGQFSFEKFNVKPTYGAPKAIEMQWRTGWGYVPHLGIAKQGGVFPRPVDREQLTPFTDQFGDTHTGYVFKNVSGHWRFSPPPPIRAGEGDHLPEAGDPLRDADGIDGVLMGLDTEAFGIAKMPEDPPYNHPNEALRDVAFPGFLQNPGSGGDIIPPTPRWIPFLAVHPQTGKLTAPDGSWWVNQTYLHGRPVPPSSAIEAHIEAPRASGQLFYQFDPLFHDNAIFSYHPSSDIVRG